MELIEVKYTLLFYYKLILNNGITVIYTYVEILFEINYF